MRGRYYRISLDNDQGVREHWRVLAPRPREALIRGWWLARGGLESKEAPDYELPPSWTRAMWSKCEEGRVGRMG